MSAFDPRQQYGGVIHRADLVGADEALTRTWSAVLEQVRRITPAAALEAGWLTVYYVTDMPSAEPRTCCVAWKWTPWSMK